MVGTILDSGAAIAGIIGAFVAVAAGGSATYARWRSVRVKRRTPEQMTLYGSPADPEHRIEATPGLVDEVRELKADVAVLKKQVQVVVDQVTRNGGASMKDTLDRLDEFLDDQKRRP